MIHEAVAKRDPAALDRALKGAPKQVNSRCYPDFETPLFMAVSLGDPAIVKRLLDAGADLTLPGVGPARFTPLQSAATRMERGGTLDPEQAFGSVGGSPETSAESRVARFREMVDQARAAMPDAEKAARLEVLALLLARKPELNKGFGNDHSPLHLASSYGDVDAVKLLIRAGANVNGRDCFWWTPLCRAVITGADRQVIDALIAAGADAGRSGKNDITPLMLAARAGLSGTVETLVAHGAPLDAEDLARNSAIGYAARGGHDALVKWIYQKGGRDLIRHAKPDILFREAAAGGSKALAEILLAEGVDVNLRDNAGYTPLLTAIENQRREMAAFLMAKGADREARVNSGRGLFALACFAGDIALVKELIASGEAEQPSPYLMVAVARQGDMAMMELLIETGADVNGVSPNGMTPLIGAVLGGAGMAPAGGVRLPSEDVCARMVELLLKNGAKVDSICTGQTAVHFAAQYRGARVMKALLQAGGNPAQPVTGGTSTPLQYAASLGRAETVQALLDAGAKPELLDSDGATLLHAAAYEGNSETLKLLLGIRLPVGAKSRASGTTPLHYAVCANSSECVQMLLAAGADPNAMDNQGSPVIAQAIGPKMVIETIRSAGLDERTLGRRLAMASDLLGRLRIIHRLIQSGAKLDSILTVGADHPVSLVQCAKDNGTPEIVELLENPPPAVKRPDMR
jgi:ankyrin repeat protein